MIGASTERAPDSSVVLPYFAFSSVSFLVMTVLILLSQTELMGSYFQGKILAITHVGALGWITMVIFGALFQLIPVVMFVPLYSEKMAKLSFYLIAVGIVGITHSFWVMMFNFEIVSVAGLLLLGILFFAINVVLTAAKADKFTIESVITISSVFWFLLTGVIGFLISLNYKFHFLSISHIELLKVHAHAGLVGWFLLLIVGIGAVLIPMFFLSHQLNKKKLYISFYSINFGLIFYVLDILFIKSNLLIVPIILITLGIIGFMSFVYESYKKRARKNLDIGLKHTVVSVILLVLPIVFSLIVSGLFDIDNGLLQRSIIFYGASIIVGFISSLVLGQYYKTLPFIIWLKKYQPYVGKFKTKLPKDMYSEKLLVSQFWLYNVSIIFFFMGILFGVKSLLLLGSILLLLTAIVFNINVFKMFFHKVGIEELPSRKK